MSQFKSICPHCFMHYRLDTSYLGKIAQCSGCRKTFVLESINETMSFIPDLDGIVSSDDEPAFNKESDIDQKKDSSVAQPSSDASGSNLRPLPKPQAGKSSIGRNPNKSTVISADHEDNKKANLKGDVLKDDNNSEDNALNERQGSITQDFSGEYQNQSGFAHNQQGNIVLNHPHYPSSKTSDDITDPSGDSEDVKTDSLPLETSIETETPEGIWNVGDVVLGIYEVRPLAPGLPYAQGGVGIVQRIYHREWDMDLAVKSPKPGTFRSEIGISSYERECQTWIELGLHPNIVTCYLIRRIDNLPRIFAEFIPDGSLRDWIADMRLYEGGQEVSLLRILDVAIQFAWGLDYAHRQGLLHLDVKPANVMMSGQTPKVTDFGLAQATTGLEQDAGTSKWEGMTPGFCSPEQYEAYMNFRKKTKDANLKMTLQSDIWSWAISVFSMFHGHAPCRKGGQTAAKAFETFLSTPTSPKRPKMPTEMISLMRHCFQVNPKDRPRSMSEVAERLIDVYGKVSGSPYPRMTPSTTRISAESLNNRAVSFLDLNKEKEARTLFHEALQIDPNHSETVYNQTLHLWRNGDITDQEAVERMNTLVKIRNDAVAFFALGLTQRERGNIAPALFAFEKAIEKKERPDFQKAMETAQIFANKGIRCTDRLSFRNSNKPGSYQNVAYLNEKENLLLLALDSERFLFYDLKSYRKGFVLKRSDGGFQQPSSEDTDSIYEGENSFSSETWTDQDSDAFFESLERNEINEINGNDYEKTNEKAYEKNREKNLKVRRRIAMSEDFQWELFCVGSMQNLILAHVGNVNEQIEFHEIPWGATQLDLLGILDQKKSKNNRSQQYPFDSPKNLQFRLKMKWEDTNSESGTSTARENNGNHGGNASKNLSTRSNSLNDFQKANDSEKLDRSDRLSSQAGGKEHLSYFSGSRSNTKLNFVQGLETTHPHSGVDLAAFTSSSHFATDSILEAGSNVAKSNTISWDIQLQVDDLNDHEVQIHDQTHGVIVGTLRGHEEKVLSLSHGGAKGEWIATGSKDRTIRLWEIPNCRCVRTLAPLDGSVDAVYLSRSGRHLFAIVGGNSFRIWDMEILCRNEEQLHAPILLCKVASSEEISRQQNEIAAFQKKFSSSMQQENYADVVKLLKKIRKSTAWDMVRKEIPWDKLLQKCVREAPNETECVYTFTGHEDKVASVALSIDGQLAVSAGNDQTIRMWNTTTGKCVRVIEGHQDWIRDVAITWDGRYILSGSWDSTVRIWSTGSGRCVRLLDDRIRSISKVAFHPLGRIAAVATAGGSILLWNVVEDRVVGNWSAHRGGINAISFNRDGRFLVSAGDDSQVCIWDTFTQRLVRKFSHGKQPLTAAKLLTGLQGIISAAKDGTIEIQDLQNSKASFGGASSGFGTDLGLGHSQVISGHVAEISALEMIADNRFFVSASRDQTIKVWNFNDRTLQKTLSGHSGPITGMAVDFSGTKIVSGSEDGTVRFWNLFWNLSFPGFQPWNDQAKPVLQSLLALYCKESTGTISPKLQPQSLQRILLEFGYRGFGWIRPDEVRTEIQKMLDHWTGPPQL